MDRTAKLTQMAKWLFILIFVLKFLESCTLFGHGDALSYHMVWPKIVLNSSISEMLTEFFPFYFSGYFDSIYFLPQIIFGPGSLKAHIFSQNIHFFCSLGIISLLMVKIFGKNLTGFLAALSVLTVSKGSDFFLYAKNDGALAAIAFLSYLIVDNKIEIANKKLRAVTIGLLFGFIPSVKLTGFFFLIPIGAWYLWTTRKELLNFTLSLLTALIVFAPILLIKNKHLGGAILFPGFLDLFPGKLDPYLIHNFKVFTQNPFSFDGVVKNLKNFFLAKFFLVSIPYLMIRQWKIEKMISLSIIISLTYLGLWLLINGGIGEPRFIFSCFFLNLFYFFEQSRTFKLPSNKTIYLIPLLILADSKIDKSISRYKRFSWYFEHGSEKEIVMRHLKNVRIWKHITNITGKKTWILSDHYPQLYYADEGLRLDHTSMTPEGLFFNRCLEPKNIQKYKYFIFLNDHNKNPCFKIIFEQTKMVAEEQGFKIYKRY